MFNSRRRSPARFSPPLALLSRYERRNITAGQKAMAHAMLFPEADGDQRRERRNLQRLKVFQPGFSRKPALCSPIRSPSPAR
jgi:hypothetical protein